MKSKLILTALLLGVLVAFTGGVSAQAAQTQTGSIDEIISASEELSDIAELLVGEVPEVPAGTAVEEVTVKWNDNFNKKDLMYMACIIYCEAGNMSRDAKLAVANVILNRMRSKGDYAHVSTVKEVIYDHKWGTQFSPTTDGSLNNAMKIYKSLGEYEGTWRFDYMLSCIEVAKAAFCGERAVPDTFLYFNGHIDSSKAKCKNAGKSYIVIDSHIYY